MVHFTTTHGSYSVSDPSPDAFLAINKNRLKVYRDNKVYLNDKQNFQIELYNPTSADILAVIYINNKKLEGGGIVLRPAERVFLDRHISTNNKFVFNTYSVSGEKSEIEHAIQNNGFISVEFYREVERHSWDINTRGIYTNYDFNISQTDMFDSNVYDSNNINISKLSYCSSPELNDLETGKVERGEKSEQLFERVNKDFETFTFHRISYHILPVTQKKHESQDIWKTRRYCDNCGSKISKSKANFCWNCGERL